MEHQDPMALSSLALLAEEFCREDLQPYAEVFFAENHTIFMAMADEDLHRPGAECFDQPHEWYIVYQNYVSEVEQRLCQFLMQHGLDAAELARECAQVVECGGFGVVQPPLRLLLALVSYDAFLAIMKHYVHAEREGSGCSAFFAPRECRTRARARGNSLVFENIDSLVGH